MTTSRASGVRWLDQLAAEIRFRLRAQGTTQQALAAHVGITPKHMSQILSGATNGNPGLLEEIAAAVGLRIMIAAGDCEPAVLPKRAARPKPADAISQLEEVLETLYDSQRAAGTADGSVGGGEGGR